MIVFLAADPEVARSYYRSHADADDNSTLVSRM